MVRQPHQRDRFPMTPHIPALLEQFRTDGISATLDGDDDIVFTHNGLSYVLCLDAGDAQFGCLLLPNVWQVVSPAQAQQALIALNDINCRLKLVKGVMNENQVSFLIELWFPDPVAWRYCLVRTRDTLVHAVHLFVDAMQDAAAAQSALQSPLGENNHRA